MDVVAQIEELRKEVELQRAHALESWESSNADSISENDEAKSELPEGFTPQKAEELFQYIISIYDLAHEVLVAVDNKIVVNQEFQLEIVKPYIATVINSANALSEFYTEVIHKGIPVTSKTKDNFETAFSNIFYSWKDMLDRIEEGLATQEVA